jgi:hypothetical protein
MKIELYCPNGCSQFSAPADTPADDVLDRMIDAGPWYALASGETFDEMVRTALCERGRILCPDCGKTLFVQITAAEEGHYPVVRSPWSVVRGKLLRTTDHGLRTSSEPVRRLASIDALQKV